MTAELHCNAETRSGIHPLFSDSPTSVAIFGNISRRYTPTLYV
ncbi:uncharacterized protein CTRU02_202276 [Colletotrichum truncatum]|uniref:Uncharacterized protein n=1 Tax=Colletotrichum truncatum TaxID=5467 RepID=A0ACC3ZJU0_COLTU